VGRDAKDALREDLQEMTAGNGAFLASPILDDMLTVERGRLGRD
jgi:hypothetical protein